MDLLVIMYHYVFSKEEEEKFTNLHYVPFKSFQRQVDTLLKDYVPINYNVALSLLSGSSWENNKKPVMLTFDDGLKCHYHTVFPYLKALGIPAFFFIITQPLLDKTIPIIHKFHLLRNKLGEITMKNSFINLLKVKRGAFDINIEAPMELARKQYRWDVDEIKQFKYLTNYVLPSKECEDILEELFEKSFDNSNQLLKDFFLSTNNLIEMQNSGMEIGGHSHSHKALAKIPYKTKYDDINKCISYLNSSLVKPIRLFSHPYGQPNTYDEQVFQILRQKNISIAFSTRIGKNKPDENPYALKRLDPKDL